MSDTPRTDAYRAREAGDAHALQIISELERELAAANLALEAAGRTAVSVLARKHIEHVEQYAVQLRQIISDMLDLYDANIRGNGIVEEARAALAKNPINDSAAAAESSMRELLDPAAVTNAEVLTVALPETCEWSPHSVGSSYLDSGCGELFVLSEDCEPDFIKFCMYCGKKAVFVAPDEDEELTVQNGEKP